MKLKMRDFIISTSKIIEIFSFCLIGSQNLVKLSICLDISLLEITREVLFIGLMFYSQMVILHIAISWLIYINPYKFPWSYLTTAVDWTEETLQGIVPSIFGVNVTGSVFLGALGVMADS